MKKKLQFVIPVLNEEDCVGPMVQRLREVKNRLQDLEVEAIFVNDGSRDSTLTRLKDLRRDHSWISVISLSRSFGHQVALTAGLDHAAADYVCIIDGDLQDPPEACIEMLKLMKETGAQVVYGLRKKRNRESWFKKVTAYLFYRLINRMIEVEIPPDTGDFRLISRKVLDAFKQLREKHRFIRGMIPWLGYKMIPYEYERDARYAGVTKYPIGKMIGFALDAISSFSNKPLRSASYIGLGIVILGVVGGFYMLYLKLFTGAVVPGLTVMILTQIILGGFQILLLGLVGEYVGKIFEESKHRPLYMIDEIDEK